LGLGHEADSLIPKKMIMLRSPKKHAGMMVEKDLAGEEGI
jgi:hypothetical protein